MSILMCGAAEIIALCMSWPVADRESFLVNVLGVAVTAIAVCMVLRRYKYEWAFVLNMIAGLVIGMIAVDVLYFFF